MARRRLRDVNLPPDAFAVAMATGILAVAALDHHYTDLADALGALATAVFVVLAVGLIARIAVGAKDIAAQARDPDVALRMFTSVAACTVLAARWRSDAAVLDLFGALALIGWLVLVPLSVADVLARPRADLRDHAHGAWLLPSVATSGLAITATDLGVARRASWLLAVAVAAWLVALAVYLAVTWLVAWRAIAAPFGADAVTPDSWILMGALAIATLSGARIVVAVHALGGPGGMAGWAEPLAKACWVVASAWIPVLLYAEVWRVDRQSGSLHYEGVWWSAVFPLGMYSVASFACARLFAAHALVTISLVFFWNAVAVWAMVGLGYLHVRLSGRLRRRRRGPRRAG